MGKFIGGLRGPVADALYTFLSRAAGAAVHLALGLDAVADDPAVAMRAPRSHCMDGALEAVEGHRTALLRNLNHTSP